MLLKSVYWKLFNKGLITNLIRLATLNLSRYMLIPARVFTCAGTD